MKQNIILLNFKKILFVFQSLKDSLRLISQKVQLFISQSKRIVVCTLRILFYSTNYLLCLVVIGYGTDHPLRGVRLVSRFMLEFSYVLDSTLNIGPGPGPGLIIQCLQILTFVIQHFTSLFSTL